MAKQNKNDLRGLDDKALQHALRLETESALGKCTQAANPVIFSRIKTKQGYRQVEEMVIAQCMAHSISPSAAIGLLESELSTD